MVHLMNQAIGQAFLSHASIMANYVHNVVPKTLQDRGTPGFVGPAYQQASQMSFLLLDRLLGHHRLTPKLKQMGMS